MGLFSKNKNEQPIQLPEKYKNAIIHPLSNKLSKIRIGENMYVNEGWSVVIVAKGQPLEIFNSGLHQLSISAMPNTTRALKLNECKVKKSKNDVKMNAPDSFLCDLYFVNLSLHKDIPWYTGKIGIRSKRYGMYSIKISGTVSIMVTKPLDFIRLFLYQWSHIPVGKDKKYLSSLLDEECQLLLAKSDYTDPNDFLDNPKIITYLTENLNKNFAKYGIKIENVAITSSDISGRVATMLQAEQNGDSGLSQIVTEHIDSMHSNPDISEQSDITLKSIIAQQDTQNTQDFNETDKELVFVKTTPKNKTYTQANSTLENKNLAQSLSNISDNCTEIEQNDIKNTNLTTISNSDSIKNEQIKISKETKTNYRKPKKAIKKQKNQLSDTKKSTVAQTSKIKDTGFDYLKNEEEIQRYINISDDIVCPKCGSIMLDGVCINCKHKKDNNIT